MFSFLLLFVLIYRFCSFHSLRCTKLLVPRNNERMIKKKKKRKKAWDLGSSRNHLSSFIYYTFNIKVFTYHTCGNHYTSVVYEPSNHRC